MTDYQNVTGTPILLAQTAGNENRINEALNKLDAIASGTYTKSISLTGLSTYTLTVANQTTGSPGDLAANTLVFTGTPSGGTVAIHFPLLTGSSSVYVTKVGLIINNQSSSGLSVIADSGGTTVAIPSLIRMLVNSDGTNVYAIEGGSGGGTAVTDGVTAADGNQSTALVLNVGYSRITSAGTSTPCVKIPSAMLVGESVIVANTTDQLVAVYPPSGGAIGGLATNAAFLLLRGGGGTNSGATTVEIIKVATNVYYAVSDTLPRAAAALANQDFYSWDSTNHRMRKTAFSDSPSVKAGLNGSTVSFVAAEDVALGITATGSDQSGAAGLARGFSHVGTVSSGTGVRLPTTLVLGEQIRILNNGANTLRIYPPSGAAIDGLGTNNPLLLASGACITLAKLVSTQYNTVMTANVPALGTTYTPSVSLGTGAQLDTVVTLSNVSPSGKAFVVNLTINTAGSNGTYFIVDMGSGGPWPFTSTPANTGAKALTQDYYAVPPSGTTLYMNFPAFLPVGTYQWQIVTSD